MTTKALRVVASGGDKRKLDKLVEELRAIVVHGHVRVILQVAEKIVDEIFGGNLELALARRGNKAASLRQLALRADEFGMTASGVMCSVPIYQQAREFGRALAEQLNVEHHRVLLPIRNLDHRKLLAEQAVEHRWSVKRLREEARKKQPPHAGGREPNPSIQSIVDALHRSFEGRPLDEIDEGLDRLGQAQAADLLRKLNQVRGHLDRLEKVLVRLNIQRARAAD